MMRFKVAGMTCGHCGGVVRGSVQKVVPGATVEIDLPAGIVAVSGADAAKSAAVEAAIAQAGYKVERRGA